MTDDSMTIVKSKLILSFPPSSLLLQACICRCAQPMAGVQGKRSDEDEQLLE